MQPISTGASWALSLGTSGSSSTPCARFSALSSWEERSTSASQSDPPALAWQQFGFEDLREVGPDLGAGASGRVKKVVSQTTGETFAMKVIPKKSVEEHQMLHHLRNEVRTQMAMKHPNIILLHDAFEDSEHVYLVLEYASGGSLYSMMQTRGRLPESTAAMIFLDIANAVSHLHSKGIIHRDVKPENVLLCEHSIAKLADFGWCAEMPKDGAERYTLCGTWDYLAPEMLHNEPHGAPVDIWTLGVLLFEMLTGRAPFIEAKRVDALRRITQVDLRFPSEVSATAQDLLRQLIVRAPQSRLPLRRAVEHPWVQAHMGQSMGKTWSQVPAAQPQQECPGTTSKPLATLRSLSRERLNKIELDSPPDSPRQLEGPAKAADVDGTPAAVAVARAAERAAVLAATAKAIATGTRTPHQDLLLGTRSAPTTSLAAARSQDGPGGGVPSSAQSRSEAAVYHGAKSQQLDARLSSHQPSTAQTPKGDGWSRKESSQNLITSAPDHYIPIGELDQSAFLQPLRSNMSGRGSGSASTGSPTSR